MRIFVLPRNGDSFDRTVRRAVEILHSANILSAKPGGTINDRAVVLVDPEDILEAMATLRREGMLAIAN
jgi:hypothetical protein